jgi:hypothetical protein
LWRLDGLEKRRLRAHIEDMPNTPRDTPAEKIDRDRLIGLAGMLGISDAATMDIANVREIMAKHEKEPPDAPGLKP